MFMYMYYNLFSMVFLFFGSLFILLGLMSIMNDYVIFIDWEILSLNSVPVTMTFLFDWMSLLFLGGVLFISSMVLLYSDYYMMNDIFKVRFLFLLIMFIFSMMFLIISPNLVSILLGWDGLGLVSYCLVIYFSSYKSNNAGMLTILINRIGDTAILISISWIMGYGSYNFFFSFYCSFISWIVLMVILAAFTKSAQIPFSSWLPAAMAAPTPVSSLVHSSTLVTAGVYLLIRFYHLLSTFNLSWFLLLSCLTMFMSGLCACFEYDLKKVIALSTLSQLGFMMSVLFLGYPVVSFFHLLSHAFFKALLFLCAGLIIHVMSDSQDIRHMGFISCHSPYVSSCFCISNFSLCGIPFMSGFYSKDLIIHYMIDSTFNSFVYFMFFFSAGLTAYYSLRLVYYCVLGNNGMFVCQSYFEGTLSMLSLILLTFMSIFFGSFFSWLIFPLLGFYTLPIMCQLMPIFLILLGIMFGYLLSMLKLSDVNYGLLMSLPFSFLGLMWFLPVFSTSVVVYYSLSLSSNYCKVLDSGWCESLISNSFRSFMNYLSKILSSYQLNNFNIYLLGFLLWFLFSLIIIY
uniref:NADH dehydrogenase subunit 5 n=1 Tax=Brachyplatys subaeneus TaxID=355284 RepID=UPI001D111CD3|nr:NADH dehydrogenase subunit 5 [Brachyplatys subaeneus]UCC45916.1 NADH dehydrogenase subunit 5 [Brachyplatys subaeneus]